MNPTVSSMMLDRSRCRPCPIGWLLPASLLAVGVPGRPASAPDEEPPPYAVVTPAVDPEVPPDEPAAADVAPAGQQPADGAPAAEPPEPAPQPAAQPPSGPQSTLFHVPPSSAAADEPLEVSATLTESWQIRSIDLSTTGWIAKAGSAGPSVRSPPATSSP